MDKNDEPSCRLTGEQDEWLLLIGSRDCSHESPDNLALEFPPLLVRTTRLRWKF
jgi:hypothetical protein